MAGFVAAAQLWDVLEPALDAIMGRYGVPVLHTKDFKSTAGVFKGWSRLRKRSFVEELFSAAHGRMYGVSISVHRKGHAEQQKSDTGLRPMSSYAVCFSAIMMEILRQPQLGPDARKQGVDFIVESGNKNDGGLRSFFDGVGPSFGGCARSLTFASKASSRAIQIADFYAYFSRRHAIMSDRFKGKLALPADWYFEAITRHVPQRHLVVRGSRSTGKSMKDFPEFAAD